jgi:hypothetical protein
MTHAAVVRTMIDMDRNHPVTRHLSVGYWKGGDEEIEQLLYQPRNVEKIVAWGGMNSIKHIARYIQPGIDLITLEPKLSSSIIGREAFADDATMREAVGCWRWMSAGSTRKLVPARARCMAIREPMMWDSNAPTVSASSSTKRS